MYYLYNESGSDHGPFSLEDLRAKVTNGEFASDKLARAANSKQWATISHFLPDLLAPVASNASASANAATVDCGVVAALGLRVCAWLYFAASLITGFRFMFGGSGRGAFGDISALIGFGMIFQGAAAFFFFLVVAAICDNVRAILSK